MQFNKCSYVKCFHHKNQLINQWINKKGGFWELMMFLVLIKLMAHGYIIYKHPITHVPLLKVSAMIQQISFQNYEHYKTCGRTKSMPSKQWMLKTVIRDFLFLLCAHRCGIKSLIWLTEFYTTFSVLYVKQSDLALWSPGQRMLLHLQRYYYDPSWFSNSLESTWCPREGGC